MAIGRNDANEIPERKETQVPEENAFTQDITDARQERHTRGGDAADEKPEVPVQKLDASQKGELAQATKALVGEFSKADDGLKDMAKQGEGVSDERRAEFNTWFEGYKTKVLAELRKNVGDIGNHMSFKTTVPVQVYGNPGEFKPETVNVQVPPRPQDLFISGDHTGITAHSSRGDRDRNLHQSKQDDFSVGASMHEVHFRLKRAGIL